MKITPIPTDFFSSEKDLIDFLLKHLKKPKEKSLIFISSKLVSLWQKRFVPLPEEKSLRERLKLNLAKKEAEIIFFKVKNKREYLITKKNSALLLNAGIDSAYGKYFILHPKEPFKTAKIIQKTLKKRLGLKKIGLAILDSQSQPFRRGKRGYVLGFFGVCPYLRTTKSQPFPYNVIDALAGLADCYMSQSRKLRPIVVFEGVDDFVYFDEKDWQDDFFVGKEKDVYRNLISKA